MSAWLLKIRQIKNWILDLIFPKVCVGCQEEGSYLCDQCFGQIDFNQQTRCVLCQQQNDPSGICPVCRQPAIFLDRIWVATDYNDRKIQELVASLKYKYITELSEILGKVLAEYLKREQLLDSQNLNSDNCLIVPVPLHPKRLLVRGFNQSALLAEQISQRYGFPGVNLLHRIVNTQTQVHLKRQERQKNVKDAFALQPGVDYPKNKKIILIDDVLTTASTLNECAKVLKKAGYETVCALVIAQRVD